MNPNGPESIISEVDRTHRTFIDYIERTRTHYLAEGFNNPYQWAFYDSVPFTRFERRASESRIALITTAAEYQPDKGDQGPRAPYNNDAKFKDVYTRPLEPPPDLRISHIGYDRANTVPEDINAYFPLAQMKEFVRQGRIGSLPPRFYAVPTLRSQRHTNEIDAPTILEWCREDAVDAAILPAV
jgi:D-proline reductase (dithiol) PrdB